MAISTVSSCKSRPTESITSNPMTAPKRTYIRGRSKMKTRTTNNGVAATAEQTRRNKLTGNTKLVVWYQRNEDKNHSHKDTVRSPRVAKQRKSYNTRRSKSADGNNTHPQRTYTTDKKKKRNDESSKSHNTGNPATTAASKNKRTHPGRNIPKPSPIRPKSAGTGQKPRKLHTYQTKFIILQYHLQGWSYSKTGKESASVWCICKGVLRRSGS